MQNCLVDIHILIKSICKILWWTSIYVTVIIVQLWTTLRICQRHWRETNSTNKNTCKNVLNENAKEKKNIIYLT